MKASDLFVQCLEAEGVEYVFGIPGEENLDLLESLRKSTSIKLGAMPMVMLTGQKPIKASKQAHFQIVDIVDMMRPLTKGTWSVVSGDNIAAHVREAFRRAQEERPGATHIELPEDVADEQTRSRPLNASYVRRPVAEDTSILSNSGRSTGHLGITQALADARRRRQSQDYRAHFV